MTNPEPQRVCFRLRLKPGHLADYRRIHAAVWPDMLVALRDAGWRNYSIFTTLDETVIGYFECDDLDDALARMDAAEVNARWQAAMAEHFEEADLVTGDHLEFLDPAFNLDAQLQAAGMR